DGCVVTSILHESIHGLFFVHLAVALHITIRHGERNFESISKNKQVQGTVLEAGR
ncbi:hypothetical protein FHS16_004751, partial [Paenibacillus endophyticus]|nr:hypothetical protein [Paenibacillus endophyticus]